MGQHQKFFFVDVKTRTSFEVYYYAVLFYHVCCATSKIVTGIKRLPTLCEVLFVESVNESR